MAQESENVDNSNINPVDEPIEFKDWLKSNRLDSLFDKLVNEGFETKEDFEGLSKEDLNKLCNKLNIVKIGLKNRFVKIISQFNLISMPVITPQEHKILSNLENCSNEANNIVEKYKENIDGITIHLYNLFKYA